MMDGDGWMKRLGDWMCVFGCLGVWVFGCGLVIGVWIGMKWLLS